jgi:3-phenylpropionate/trans-cinnamate dioxygenase ferredoxin reductase component
MAGSVLIVGAGQAGMTVAQTLREGGYAGPITLVGNEKHGPYQRPPLSKKFLSGELEASRLELKPEAWFPANNVTLQTDIEISRVDITGRTAQHAGGSLAFDHLVFATGTRSRRPPIPGLHLPGVHTLRDIADVDRLRPSFRPGKTIAIIGAGYIGLEVAAVARGLGLDVVVIEAAERVLARSVSPDVSSFFTSMHRAEGVDLRLATGIASVEAEGAGLVVATTAQERIQADVVLVATGAQPNTELAEAAGVSVRDGILVDGQGRASAPGVYAAGDCTRFDSARYGRSIRLESVQNAIDQAKAVAGTILGKPGLYDPLPWFWSDQYDVKLQIAGLSQGYDKAVMRPTPDERSFSVYYLKDNVLIAVDSVNRARDHMMGRRLIGQQLKGSIEDLSSATNAPENLFK